MSGAASCRVCNRPLTNPARAVAGIGPICARRYPGAAGNCDLLRASYTVARVAPGFVFIVDQDKGRSVTNDAAGVVAELHAQFGDARIIYRDTMGRWDELLHDGARFLDFAPLPPCFDLAGLGATP